MVALMVGGRLQGARQAMDKRLRVFIDDNTEIQKRMDRQVIVNLYSATEDTQNGAWIK